MCGGDGPGVAFVTARSWSGIFHDFARVCVDGNGAVAVSEITAVRAKLNITWIGVSKIIL